MDINPRTAHVGRHDDALSHDGINQSAGSLRQIDVDLLRPGRYQPRREFVSGSLAELAESIQAEGVVQPIIVRPLPDTTPQSFEIIAGERRWRAAQLAGFHQVPTLVRPLDDRATLVQALLENLQREDLNPVDAARGVERLIDEFQLTHQEAARRLGRSRDAISHLLRILKLDSAVLAHISSGQLSLGHAKLLPGLPQSMQRELAEAVVHQGLSVRALENRIRNLNGKSKDQPTINRQRDPDIVRLEQRVGEIVGAETRIDYDTQQGRGRLVFTFHSLEALDGILERLGYQP